MPVPAPRSKIAPKKAPQSDPKFQRVTGRLNTGAARLKQHPPARTKAAQAQAAAVPPAKEKLAGAKAKQVDKMQQAKPKPVEPNGFLVMLRAEIEKVMPQNLDEADKFMEGGEQQQMKGAVTGKVNAQKDAATGEVKTSTKQAPDPSGVPGKQVTPIPGEPAPASPQLNAGEGMPSPKPEAEVTQKEYKENADQQLKDAEVTPTQLKKANDPRFSAVLTAKEAVEKTADAAPGKYRAAEKGTLAQAVVKATGDARTGAAALVGAKTRSGTAVRARQNAAKERDEKRRKEVTDTIEGIYNSTKASVEAKLGGLETQVTSMFDAGASAAISNMKANSNREIEDFKDDRYSGITGKARWLADLFRPVPQGIKDILARNRVRFTQEMDGLIVNISNVVETRLSEAKGEIDKGQTKIKAFVASLPLDLQTVGRAAEQEVAGRFDELRQGVEDKKNDLAQKLAQKYKEASDKADAELKKIEEANAGALRGLIDKLAEIIRILADFKNKLVSLIRKGMETIKLIIADPIGFLGNIIAAIKQGIELFKTNFFKHLQDAFIKWLFGAMEGAGIQLPANLSLPEILKFVLSVLGITYEKMRQKAVKLLGPTAVAIIEKVVEYVKALIQGGPAALWEKVKEDLSNLKAMVIDAIIAWVTETIVKQAVMKIVSMFNPAGAIIQAIIAIYNVVMFVIERASQIMTFVEAVINSVHDIATGAIGGAAKKIETALASALVLVISFLARLIGLGGISQKIKEFITKVQTVVDKAIDKAIGKVVDVAKKLFGKGKDGKPDERTEKQKLDDLKEAVVKAKALEKKQRRPAALAGALAKIKQKYRLTDLTAQPGEKGLNVHAAVNPEITFQIDPDVDDELAKKIAEKAGPLIAALPGSAKVGAIKAALDQSLKEACKDLKSDSAGKNLSYKAVTSGKGLPMEDVILYNRGEATKIGAIWNTGQLYEPTANPVGGAAATFKNRVTKEIVVQDAKKQYVQRWVIRNLSEQDISTIRAKQGVARGSIQPTGDKSRTTIQEHVMGVKPSPYISTTKTPGGQITNEKGESFNSGQQAKIDLCHISSKNIFDLSTKVGQDEWGLSTPSSPKAEQALKDVIRTQEVLIKGEIPAKALSKT